ncbi:MAG TPA: UbiA-like polyprenyltransferase [Candidatus Acidoferrales bacterium]|nr:UbiA-like polyprenyltransferase [Candidatus Acidoferrales bacterium]
MQLLERFRDYGRLIRFSHTVFALPFALSAVVLAGRTHPVSLRTVVWILIAMIGARSAAMGFNRVADRKFDALNPRTKDWELPQGKIKVSEAVLLTSAASILFLFAAYQLNWICFVLSPVALAIVFFYSLTKRFTWASHFFLGLALALAPIGAWLAIAGIPSDPAELGVPLFLGLAVLFWLAGFDVLYSLQDYEFDRMHGLRSIPVRFGIVPSLRLSSLFHALTVVFLALVGVSAALGVIYWVGLLLVSAILLWEHSLVRPDDLSGINRAFFDFNAYVSIGYFVTTLGDLLWRLY